MLAAFALRNVFRHRMRSVMTLVVIATGVAALIVSGGFVEDLYRQLGDAIIHSQTGHLQVAKPEFFGGGSRSPEKYRISDPAAVERDFGALPGVVQVSARLGFAGLLSNTRTDRPILGEGIEPDKEAKLATSIAILAGRTLTSKDRHGMLVGEGLAKALDLHPGDPVTLLATTVDGAMNTADLEVTGIFRSFSRDYDARAVKIPLDAAQDLIGTRDANTVVVLLADTADSAGVQAAAQPLMRARGLEVKRWDELNDFYANTVRLYDRQFGVLRVIILFMVALGVANAINMAIFERLGEFGTMRALGDPKARVFRLIVAECTLLGVLGAAAGVILGISLSMLVSWIGIPMPPPPNSNIGFTARIEISRSLCATAFAFGVVATVLAGLVPALRARSVPIVDALRQWV